MSKKSTVHSSDFFWDNVVKSNQEALARAKQRGTHEDVQKARDTLEWVYARASGSPKQG
ncbi:TPA: hypothetical protein QDB06_000782 [Burkholderia vietnamiensis]|nr:hypothetical protein [Burkholderia vietnamiensis]